MIELTGNHKAARFHWDPAIIDAERLVEGQPDQRLAQPQDGFCVKCGNAVDIGDEELCDHCNARGLSLQFISKLEQRSR